MLDEDYTGNIVKTKEESIEATSNWYNRLSSTLNYGMGCGMLRCGECPLYVQKNDDCGAEMIRNIFESMRGKL
jgi:hypothetical protein